MTQNLYLHEEFMLLALREEKGTTATSQPIEFPLAAAILSELLLEKRIEIDPIKKKKLLINVIDATPFNEPILDEALAKINDAKRRASLKNWVKRIAQLKKLKHRVALQLCQRRIVRADEDKILLIFTRKIYPEIDPRPELNLVKRMRKAIFSDTREVDPRDAVLVGLSHHTGLLRKKFDKQDLKARKTRIKEIMTGQLTVQAAKEAIDAMHAAIFAAVIIPAVVGGGS